MSFSVRVSLASCNLGWWSWRLWSFQNQRVLKNNREQIRQSQRGFDDVLLSRRIVESSGLMIEDKCPRASILFSSQQVHVDESVSLGLVVG